MGGWQQFLEMEEDGSRHRYFWLLLHFQRDR